jgi:DNA-binding NarL/FixJ family response regulator
MRKKIKLAIFHRVTLFRHSLMSVLGTENKFRCLDIDYDSAYREVLERERPDVFLVELDLPNDLGIELTKYARRCDWDPKIVVLVSAFSERHVAECVAAGAHAWVHEASSMDDLRGAIDDVLNGRTFCSHEFVREMFAHVSSVSCRTNTTGRANKVLLTERENEVLNLISRGMSNKEIAKQLSVSLYTVKHHVHHILAKLDVDSRHKAARSVTGGYHRV